MIAQARAELATAEADDSASAAAASQATDGQEQGETEATDEAAAAPVAELALYRSIAAEPGGPSLQASA